MTMTIDGSKAAEIHRSALVIDAHADTPQRFVDEHFDLADGLQGGNFNLDSARRGNVGAQVFAVWVEPSIYKGRYAARALDLIEGVKQQAMKHAQAIALVNSPEGIEETRGEDKLAILLGIEGGHAIENSLATLRQFHALGACYMTLTWSNSTGWADSSGDENDPAVAHTDDGLTAFGVEVVREMNRLGMMVDISHVSDKTFYRVVEVSQAPVIASHSGARAVCNVPRNLTDEMLRTVASSGGPDSEGGVVMVNFYSAFVSQQYRDALEVMRPEIDREIDAYKARRRAEGAPAEYAEIWRIHRTMQDRIPRPPLSELIDHIDHIAKIAGVDHVGLGSDFDGIFGQLPEGMDSAADLPKITAALVTRGYSAEDCRKILGENFLRVFSEVQAKGKELQSKASR